MNQKHFVVIATQRAESAYYELFKRQGAALRGSGPVAIGDNKGSGAVFVEKTKTRAEAEKVALKVAYYAGLATGGFGHAKALDPEIKIVKASSLEFFGRSYRLKK